MSDKPQNGLDRRAFVVAAITSGTAALAAAPGLADAQQATTSPAVAGMASASQGTVYTGDMIQGKKVISGLSLADLEPGKKHFFYFQGVQAPSGQHWHVSVVVAKGHKAGQEHRPHQRRAW